MGRDMKGWYFVQLTGNEEAIKKFRKINKHNDITFYKKKHTLEDVMSLKNFSQDLFACDCSCDVVEHKILKGKFVVPGENKVHTYEALGKWWEKYADYAKYPDWGKLAEEVIDLSGDDDDY